MSHDFDGIMRVRHGSPTFTARKHLPWEADRELLQSILNLAPVSVFVKDRMGRLQFMSSAAAEFTGICPEHAIGKDSSALFPADIAAKVVSADWMVLDTGEAQSLVFEDVRSGSLRVYSLVERPLRDEKGRMDGILGTMHDVTEQWNAEQALLAVNDKLQGIVTAVPAAVVALDLDLRVKSWNPAAEQIFGWTEGEVIGSYPPFIPEYERELTCERMRQSLNGASYFDVECRRVRKDGTQIDMRLCSAPLHDAHGVINGIIGIFSDITYQKDVERALQAVNGSLEDRVRERTLALEDAIRRSELSRSDLEAANRELNAFTVSVSHDLRGPLTIISGYARAFLDHYSQRLDDTGRGLISNVIWGCDRMNHLINSLLRLARFSQAEMRFETVDLTALAWESIQEARELSDARLVEVQIEDGMIVSGDQEMLRVAIDNLVRNAWKFTRKCPDAIIRIGRLDRNPDPDGKKVFFIRDNGVGFESGQADTLFKAFHRLHSTSEFEGTGIGLATVERIVLRHGGYAWAEGAVDQGACIYFAL